MSQPNPISDHLRTHKQAISDAWEAAIADGLPELHRLDRSARVDHLPEFLDGLARWVEGDTQSARSAFDALAIGHALQRIGYGVELRTLTSEYALLRTVILRELRRVARDVVLDDAMIRLHEGMDEAIYDAVWRYAERRDQMRDRFVGIVSHDLRNPLSTILISAGRIAQGAGELRGVGLTIERSAERMSRMINDLLDFTRGHLGGGIPVALVPGDLGAIAREVVDEIRGAHPARDIALEAIGDLHGMFDRDRVLQALSNLVANAVQHGIDPIRVRVAESLEGRALDTSVTSRGRALAPIELAGLFDPFRAATSTRREGLGLGLYIVKQIALAHGAACDVSSSDDEGTTFTIRWPRTRADEATDYR